MYMYVCIYIYIYICTHTYTHVYRGLVVLRTSDRHGQRRGGGWRRLRDGGCSILFFSFLFLSFLFLFSSCFLCFFFCATAAALDR